MQKSKEMKILIPEGCFKGNCYTCFYAKEKEADSNGRWHCRNSECEGYYLPEDRKNCPHYSWKIKMWLLRGILLYFIITMVVIMIEHC